MAKIVTIINDLKLRERINLLLQNSSNLELASSFSTGNDFLEFIDIIQCDLILLDIDDEFEIAIDLIMKMKSKHSNTIIIVLSAQEDEVVIYKSFSSGADGYLLKNISSEEITDVLNEVPNGEAPLSSCIAKKLVEYFRKSNYGEMKNIDYDLSPREKEVLQKFVEGNSMKEIGKALFISIDTVRFHSKNIYRKLKVKNQAEMVAKTLRYRIL